jgi:hypothetical protein
MYHHFQQYFSYIVGQLVAVSFIGGGNPSTQKTPVPSVFFNDFESQA